MKILSIALLTAFALTLPSCGGGGGTKDFENDAFEVDFDKSEDTHDLPAVSSAGDDKIKIVCGGDKTTEDGGAEVACDKADWTDFVTCNDGNIVSMNDGETECQSMIVKYRRDEIEIDECD